MSSNWGIMAGGIAKGLGQGFALGNAMQENKRQRKIDEDDDNMLAELKALYEQNGMGDAMAAGQVEQPDPVKRNLPDKSGPGAPADIQQNLPDKSQQGAPAQPKTYSLSALLDVAGKEAMIKAKYGKASMADIVKLKKLATDFRSEGMEEAVGLLHAGDAEGALRAYNEMGSDGGYTLKGPAVRGTTKIVGHDVPSVQATFVSPDGREFFVDTAQTMFNKLSFDKVLNAFTQAERTSLMRDREGRIASGGGGGGGRSNYGKTFSDVKATHPDWSDEQVDTFIQENGLVGRRPGAAGGIKPLTEYQRAKIASDLDKETGGEGNPLVSEANFESVQEKRRALGKSPLKKETDPGEEPKRFLGLFPYGGRKPSTRYVEDAEAAPGAKPPAAKQGTKPAAAEQLPRDPKLRKKGQTYMGPDGNRYQWDGTGLIRR